MSAERGYNNNTATSDMITSDVSCHRLFRRETRQAGVKEAFISKGLSKPFLLFHQLLHSFKTMLHFPFHEEDPSLEIRDSQQKRMMTKGHEKSEL